MIMKSLELKLDSPLLGKIKTNKIILFSVKLKFEKQPMYWLVIYINQHYSVSFCKNNLDNHVVDSSKYSETTPISQRHLFEKRAGLKIALLKHTYIISLNTFIGRSEKTNDIWKPGSPRRRIRCTDASCHVRTRKWSDLLSCLYLV